MTETTVKIALYKPGPLGPVPATGRVDCTPTLRRNVDPPAGIVLPDSFTVRLGYALRDTDGTVLQPATEGVAWAQLEATDTGPYANQWAWRFSEHVEAGTQRYTFVPTSGSVVDYVDLVDIDPASFDPLPPPVPAWLPVTDDLQDQIDTITGSDVETVAGVGPTAGDVPTADLKTALSLPADTAADVGALDSRLDVVETTEATYGDIVTHNASEFTTDAELASEANIRGSADTTLQNNITAEAALARNADNLTSGTVADARIAGSIARDTEVASAVAAEAALARNGDNITSGTIADARIASTIARDGDLVKNVKDYGALGDGTTNDTAAINTAIAALTAGDTLYFPRGRYMTNGGHTISTPSVKIVGATGRGQTFNSSAQLFLRNAANSDMLTIAASQVTARDLTLHGQFSGQSGTSRGLVVNDGSNYLLLDAVWVTSFNGDGMVFGVTTGTLSATVSNCESRLNQGYGMKFNAGGTDTAVSDSYIDQNVLSGISCSTGDISFSNCHIWGNGTGAGLDADGMRFQSSSACRVENCYIESNTSGAGIRFRTGTMANHIVTGCDIWNNGTQGIYAFGATKLVLSNNQVRQNNYVGGATYVGSGIVLENCDGCAVTGNVMGGPSPFRQTYGYYEIGTCTNNVFMGNVSKASEHGTGSWLMVASTAPTIPVNASMFNVTDSTKTAVGETLRSFLAADTPFTNNTFANICSVAVGASQTWRVTGVIIVEGGQTGDAKVRLQATNATGTTGWLALTMQAANSATSTSAVSANPNTAIAVAVSGGTALSFGTVGTGTFQAVHFDGFVTTSTTAGTLDLQMAQLTTDATALNVKAGTYMHATRVA